MSWAAAVCCAAVFSAFCWRRPVPAGLGGNLLLAFIAMASLLVFLLELGYLFMKAAVGLAHYVARLEENGTAAQRDWFSRLAHLLAGLAAVLGWFLLLLISSATDDGLGNNATNDYFAYPAAYAALGALGGLVVVFLILTFLLLPVLYWTWQRKIWTRPERLLFTMVCLAALGFSYILLRGDLARLLF